MLKSPKLLRSSFRYKLEKVAKEDKKIFKTKESPRLSRSSLHLMENSEKVKELLCLSYSAEGYAQETATQINYDLNFFRKKVLNLQTSNFHSLFYHNFYSIKILTQGKII